MIRILLDIMFFVTFSSSIIVFVGFWGVIFPGGILYYKEPLNLKHVLTELIMHGLNIIVPCIEFYYESKRMYFDRAFMYLLMILFSSYCLAMSALYNLEIIDWGAYLLLPWNYWGKIGIPLICFLSYHLIKKKFH
jgi:hypothetical protein